jgi:hypothetical protein
MRQVGLSVTATSDCGKWDGRSLANKPTGSI